MPQRLARAFDVAISLVDSSSKYRRNHRMVMEPAPSYSTNGGHQRPCLIVIIENHLKENGALAAKTGLVQCPA